jgi:phytanoyl-CoA hydroxylase
MLEFDEGYYLEKNPDVAEAVRKGEWPSGMTHYCITGKTKGRIAAPAVDAEWYISAYPRAALEIAAGKAANATEHYHRLGKYRGYLISQHAARAANPAATRSCYGGLWTDVGNALDIIAGRLDIGHISAEQANLLTQWVADGYVILPNAIPAAVLDSAEAELDRAYRGEVADLLFEVQGVRSRWVPETLTHPARALDLHWFSNPMRQLIFSQHILAFLQLLFERRVLATQTWSCWRGSAQEAHQDSGYVNYSLPLQCAAAWIALEDVREGAGELYYYGGSHRVAEYFYGDSKGAEEARRVTPEIDLAANHRRHRELLERQAAGMGLPMEPFRAKRGDVLISCADLVQGEAPISSTLTRKSIVAHYCPAELVPRYFEIDRRAEMKSFGATASYSTAHYRSR